MLYKKNKNETLSPELFLNPTEEYRGAPFWAWNCKVTPDLIKRQIGYLKAISDHGMIYDDTLFISDQNEFATGYRGCEKLMEQENRPTAIFATNYNITMGCITAARERGLRIPEDVDVFGYDCVDICTMLKPPLPVIQQPEEEIGRTAAMFLIERLEGYDGEFRTVRLPCHLEMK